MPRALTAAEQKLVAADNQFAFSLLRQVAQETRDTLTNLFVSPLSVAMALGMTYNGAAGTTEQGMRQALALGDMTLVEVNEANRSLIALLRGLDPRVQFRIGNSIWYKQTFSVLPAFVDATRTYFDAEVAALDFTSPAASAQINDWVKRSTDGLIDAIVPASLPPEAVLYLINAIYFKGDWTIQFDRGRTTPAPFHVPGGGTVQVPMMRSDGPVPVRAHDDNGTYVVELPYGGAAFAMTIVMPGEGVPFDSAVARLTAAQWDGWVAQQTEAEIEVWLPKFRLENDLRLVAPLAALGMGVAFDCEPPDMADFTRLHEPQEMCITDVKHKTYVDVNEEGTVAAAVTSVEGSTTSVPATLVIDRPFLVAIRERLSGTILFRGAIKNPL